MTVTAKVGSLRNLGKVRTETGTFDVRPAQSGGYVVEGPPGVEPGLVRYDEKRQILEIERPGITLYIDFRPEAERTVFDFNGHHYDVGSMEFGSIVFTEAGRPAVRGNETVSGVRLTLIEPPLDVVERELAFGLALRSAWGDEAFWRQE
ncbi:MAG TPA: hypothetical protein VEY12_08680 [Thermoplasmata archaeon]|nr:hypothetical protein [Thermoplasmata archaeon]